VNAITSPPPALLYIDQRQTRTSRANITALAAAFVVVIGWFDYTTGDFSLALFYLVPVAIATWYAGRVEGWFIGLLSAAAWLVDLALKPSKAPAHGLLECCSAR
jgi:hypothetical protein